ncbi:MAG: ABC transporter ATP-binding protein [Actinomycetia bacterium]|nr:ABC transporter ATP-binding protein [Actinomycetes bacterium]
MPAHAPHPSSTPRPLAERVRRAADIAPNSLTINGVEKVFGNTRAVDGASLHVPAGAIVALLGPSGCGKTTLLRCVAGLEKPDAGEIWLGATPVRTGDLEIPAERRGVGMVFQDWALFPHVSVARNIGFGLSRRERRSELVDELLALVGLDGLGDRPPETLSGGQQQRVALARALAHEPSAILLDEPFSNLDASFRGQIRRDVRELMRDLGITALFVTHDQEEAFELGDEVAVMIDGVVEQQAEPFDLYERPCSRAVAEFVGEATILPGHANGLRAQTAFGLVPLLDPAHGPVQVVVRPERIELTAGDDGIVVNREFYGHDASYCVRLPAGLELTARALGAPKLNVGDRAALRYVGPPAACFPAASASGFGRGTAAEASQPAAGAPPAGNTQQPPCDS